MTSVMEPQTQGASVGRDELGKPQRADLACIGGAAPEAGATTQQQANGSVILLGSGGSNCVATDSAAAAAAIHKPKHRPYRNHSLEEGEGGRNAPAASGEGGERPSAANGPSSSAGGAAAAEGGRHGRSRSRSRSPRARSSSRGRRGSADGRRRRKRQSSSPSSSSSRSRSGTRSRGRRSRERSHERRGKHGGRSRSGGRRRSRSREDRRRRTRSRSGRRSHERRERSRSRTRSPRRDRHSRRSASAEGEGEGGRRRRRATRSRSSSRSRSRSRHRRRQRGRKERGGGSSSRSRSRSARRDKERSRSKSLGKGPPARQAHRRSASPQRRKRGRSGSPRPAEPASKPPAAGAALPSSPAAGGSRHALQDGPTPQGWPRPAEAAAEPAVAGASPPSSQGRPSMVVRLRIKPSVSSGGSKGGTPQAGGPSPLSRPGGASQPASPLGQHPTVQPDHHHHHQQQQQKGASEGEHVGALSPRAVAAQEERRRRAAAGQQPGSGKSTPRAAALKQRLSFGDEIEEDEDGAAASPGGIKPARGIAVATTRRFMRERELVVLHPMLGQAPAVHAALVDEDGEAAPAASLPPAGKTLGPMHFGAAVAKGMRPYMEDRHTLVASLLPVASGGAPIQDGVPRCFAAVYDGHNGVLAAEHAADRLHHLLAAEPALRTCTGDGPPSTLANEADRVGAALRHAFEATDREILIRCRLEGNKSGATGVAVVRIGDILYAAHAGDSRAVLCRGGTAVRLTEDHKPNLPQERERVEGAGGRVDFARCWRVIVDPGGGRPASGLAVSRSFGDIDFKEPLHLVTATPDVAQQKLRPGDAFVVLASDGLWDVLTDEEACEVVRAQLQSAGGGGGRGASQPAPPDGRLATMAAESLVQLALVKGTMDNVTAVVMLLQWG